MLHTKAGISTTDAGLTPFYRSTLGLALLVLVGFCAMLAFQLLHSRAREMEHASRHAENLAIAIEGQVSALVRQVDVTLQEVRTNLEMHFGTGLPGEVDDEGFLPVRGTLSRMLSHLPGARALQVINDKGQVLYSAGAVPLTTDIGRTAHFKRLAEEMEPGLVLSAPLRAGPHGVAMTTFSRKLMDRRGMFMGVVQVSMLSSAFDELLAGMELGKKDVITLFNSDLLLIASHPPRPADFGQAVGHVGLQTALATSTIGTGTMDAADPEYPRGVIGFRKFSAVPLLVTVRLTDNGFEAPWFGSPTTVSLLAGLLATILVLTTLATQRGYRRAYDRARVMTAAAADRDAQLRALLDSLPDFVWIRDTDSRFVAVNDAYAHRFGLKKEDMIGVTVRDLWPNGEGELFHAQDQEILAGAEMIRSSVATLVHQVRKVLEIIRVPVRDHDGVIIGIAGIARDVTEREEELARQRLAASVFRNAREGIILTDDKAQILDVNDAFTRITGYEREDVLGQKPTILHSGEQPSSFYNELWDRLLNDGEWRGELINRRKSGELFVESLQVTAIRNEDGAVERFVGIFADITAEREAEERLVRATNYDALTQLPNARLTNEQLDKAIHEAVGDRTGIAVCFLDLDGFKPFNDMYGVERGDRLLTEMARRLEAQLGSGESVGRLGGDEFAVILSGLPRNQDGDTTLRAIDRVMHAFERPFDVDGQAVPMTASIGVSFFPSDGDDPERLLRQAAQAMYNAKQAGRARYVVFDPEHERRARDLNEMLGRLTDALEHGEFRLHYQPKVNMCNGKVVGAEALIRWQHPDRGLLSPAHFLPVLEGTSLAVPLGEWVIAEALRQMWEWHQMGLDLPVSVNVSAHQLQQADFTDRLEILLARYPGVRPEQLELEILETSALEDMTQVCATLERCRKIGVGFAIDDFGTGYSSLSYLKRLPATTLKIDQSFVRGILDDEDDMALVSAIIGLTKAFDRQVVAEGVETAEIGAALMRMDCHLVQGYGIARPMSPDRIPGWVRDFVPPAIWRKQVVLH